MALEGVDFAPIAPFCPLHPSQGHPFGLDAGQVMDIFQAFANIVQTLCSPAEL